VSPSADIVCFSHLRWDFVYQRPNHLMARAARRHRVYFVEEPIRQGGPSRLEARPVDGLTVIRPVLAESLSESEVTAELREALDGLLAAERVDRPWLWYYTPMALPWSAHVRAGAIVYDCMDELSAFRFAPGSIGHLERDLLRRATVVFTGGRSLHEAKRNRHPHTYLFSSSVDAAHFRRARTALPEPGDQASIARPRIGYFGVIDERIDLDLLAQVADARPDWQLVMLGPVAKVNDEDLPRAQNIHWLGLKAYAELPAYLAGWDVAMMPFAINDATRHISPTKTPEYLSGGRPVVSTPIHDVVHPYGDESLVHIAGDATDFVAGIEAALACDRQALLARSDRFLASQSWDATWAQMEGLVSELSAQRRPASVPVRPDAPLPHFGGALGAATAGGASIAPRTPRS
jgi:ribonuclease BN (tRNA processing enzyme)